MQGKSARLGRTTKRRIAADAAILAGSGNLDRSRAAHNGKRVAGTSRTANPDSSDTRAAFARGDGGGYDISPWLFEAVAVETGYRMFHGLYADSSFKTTLVYDAGSIATSTPYSVRSRLAITSNCSAPTTPTIGSRRPLVT